MVLKNKIVRVGKENTFKQILFDYVQDICADDDIKISIASKAEGSLFEVSVDEILEFAESVMDVKYLNYNIIKVDFTETVTTPPNAFESSCLCSMKLRQCSKM